MVKMQANAGDTGRGLVPRLRRSLGVGNGNSLQYSCLKNAVDKGDWQAMVHEVGQSDTTEQTHMPMLVNAHTRAAGDLEQKNLVLLVL